MVEGKFVDNQHDHTYHTGVDNLKHERKTRKKLNNNNILFE